MSTLYDVFRQSVFTLAKTMVIKHHTAAQTINNFLVSKGVAVESDLTTWKYYMNLAGDYHVSDRADLMTINRQYEPTINDVDAGHIRIKVAGTNGPVFTNLTKDLLYGPNADVSIANEYNYNSPFYKELIDKYPKHESLLLGILNPIDYAISIPAKENTILYAGGLILTDPTPKYPRYSRVTGTVNSDDLLILDNEMNLIPLLQEQINNFFYRWYNPFFTYSNNLFYPSILSALYGNIPFWIFMIRAGNAKTEYVHPFHVRSYLESFGRLGDVADALPLTALLYLYRNLRYLEANFGKQKAFDLLVENVATPSKISLQRYSIRHNLSALEQNLVPLTELHRELINPEIPGIGSNRRFPQELLNKETLQLDRFKNVDLDLSLQKVQIENAFNADNKVPSKIIESEMIDDFDSGYYSLTDMLYNYWGYLAATDRFKGSIYVTQPASGDRLLLTPTAAFILFQYCIVKGYFNDTLQKVPRFAMSFVAKEPKPDLTYVKSGCVPTLELLIAQIHSNAYPSTQLVGSPTMFYTVVENQYREILRRWFLVNRNEREEERAMSQNALNKLYWENEVVEFDATGQDFDFWLTTQGIKLDNMSDKDFQKLAKDLLETTCGLVNNPNRKLPAKQDAVLKVLKHFSSYSVQFLKSINLDRLVVAGWNQLRVMRYNVLYKGSSLTIPYNLDLPVVVETGSQTVTQVFDLEHFDPNLTFDHVQYMVDADIGNFEGSVNSEVTFLADMVGLNDSTVAV